MSSPIGYSSGSLSTNGVIKNKAGLLTYVESHTGDVALYEGSTSGKLLTSITSSSYRIFNSPVQFGSTGLYITISTGTAVVHTG